MCSWYSSKAGGIKLLLERKGIPELSKGNPCQQLSEQFEQLFLDQCGVGQNHYVLGEACAELD